MSFIGNRPDSYGYSSFDFQVVVNDVIEDHMTAQYTWQISALDCIPDVNVETR